MPLSPTRHDWRRLLGELLTQLDTGRIYNRDLDDLLSTTAESGPLSVG